MFVPLNAPSVALMVLDQGEMGRKDISRKRRLGLNTTKLLLPIPVDAFGGLHLKIGGWSALTSQDESRHPHAVTLAGPRRTQVSCSATFVLL